MSATKTKKLNDPSIPRVTEVPDSAVMLVCDAQGRLTPISVKNLRQMLNAACVDKAGDTMTGALTVQSGVDAKLIFNNTDGEKYSTISFREDGAAYLNIIGRDTGLDADKRIQAPYFTASTTTLCTNLNADLLDGKHADDFVGKTDFDAVAPLRTEFSIPSVGWWKIAKVSGFPAGGLLLVSNKQGGSHSPRANLVYMSAARVDEADLLLLSRLGSFPIEKFRLVKDGSGLYLEASFQSTVGKPGDFTGVMSPSMGISFISPIKDTSVNPTVAAEERKWGGVKCCFSVDWQKGGRHEHHKNKTAYQGAAGRHHGQCCYIQRQGNRFQRKYGIRGLFMLSGGERSGERPLGCSDTRESIGEYMRSVVLNEHRQTLFPRSMGQMGRLDKSDDKLTLGKEVVAA